MQSAINQFRINISRVKMIDSVYDTLSKVTKPIIDISDLLRTQIVMSVSALDHYVHEIVLIGMIEVFNGMRQRTEAFHKFQVSMDSVVSIQRSSGTSWLEAEIRERHSFVSFQNAERIADGVRLFSSVQLWPSVASELSMEVKDIKTRLGVIVDRRNKIVHEADSDPSNPGERWSISKADTTGGVSFIEKLCESIQVVVA